MDNEENKNGQTTGTSIPSNIDPTLDETQQKAFSKYLDPSRSAMKEKAGGLDYINGAAKTGQKGAEALEKVKVPKYTPITYKMLQNDPEVRAATPSLIRNAIFKGLEGALSTKASGRQFDPTTRMGQYDDAEMQRYTENATDKENTIYQAQKQPIENAISAQAQAGIQAEDAALNSYIQDYTAEKDQNRKFDLLKQIMGQAGLTKGVDENGNPIYKDWTELKTKDLLRLNQLMQYLSGDTSVMNLLVGQYGPEVIEKIEGFVDWIKGGGNGPLPDNGGEEPALTPEYSIEDLKAAIANGDKNAILYKQRNVVEYGDGQWYDVRDTSDAALTNLAQTLADKAVNEGTMYKGILDEIERKTYEATGKGWFNKNGKNAKQDVSDLTDYYIKELQGQKQDEFTEGSDTTGLNVSEYGDIDSQIAQLKKDKNKTSTSVDVEALKTQIEDSTMDDAAKKERLDEIAENEESIKLNAAEEEARKRRELTETEATTRAKDLDKKALKNVEGVTKTDYAKAKLKKGQTEGSLYNAALEEAKAIYDALQETNEDLMVLKKTDLWTRLQSIVNTAYNGGRFEDIDKRYKELNPKGKSLTDYLADMGDYTKWGR